MPAIINRVHYYTLTELAEYLGRTKEGVRYLLDKFNIEIYKTGEKRNSTLLIPDAEVKKLIKKMKRGH